LISDKAQLRTVNIVRGKESHFIKNDINLHKNIVLNVQAFNNITTKTLSQNRELQRETEKFSIIVEEFSASLIVIDKSTRQKINMDRVDLNSTIYLT
jgi:hypothetical protein